MEPQARAPAGVGRAWACMRAVAGHWLWIPHLRYCKAAQSLFSLGLPFGFKSQRAGRSKAILSSSDRP